MEDMTKEVFYKERNKEEGLDVRVKFNLGKLEIKPFSGDRLYELTAEYPNENYAPNIKYSGSSIGVVSLESQKITSTLGTSVKLNRVSNLFNKDKRNETVDSNSNNWKLQLNKDLPVELDISSGASEQNLELGGMKLKHLNLSTGASLTIANFTELNQERLDLSVKTGASSFECKNLANANIEKMTFNGGVGKSLLNFSGHLVANSLVEISAGLGMIELEIPSNVGVKIGVPSKRILSIVNIPETFTKTGEIYINEAYDDAKPHFTINVNMSVGSLNIKEI